MNEEIDTPIRKIRIKVIGIGGGGGKIVSEIAPFLNKVDFWTVDTDRMALARIGKAVKTLCLETELNQAPKTKEGAMRVKQTNQKEREKIKKILSDCDLCILVTCLGGELGSRFSSVFAQISQKAGNITYGVFTLPFKFEGEKKSKAALDALRGLKSNLNGLSVIPNEKIFEIIDRKIPLRKAFSRVNEILTRNLDGLIKMIYKSGLINIDFADLITILKGRGQLVYLVNTEGEETKEMFEKITSGSIYPYGMKGARKILFEISGPRDLSLAETAEISAKIFGLSDPDSKIIFGVSPGFSKKIGISLLAVGCKMNDFLPASRKKPGQTEKTVQALKTQPKQKKEKRLEKKSTEKKRETGSSQENKGSGSVSVPIKIRKNGLQLQKETKALEEELQKKEEVWEMPAFLRRLKKHA